MRSILLATATALALGIGGAALAAGGGGGASVDTPAAKPADANYTRAKALIEAKDYKGAMPLLQQVVAKDPKNADAYNLMGYATRKSGDPNGSLQYYNQAITIDPKHIGAHEYIGEAYLMLDQLPQAEQHLAKLEEANLVSTVRHGREKLHYLNPVPIHEIHARWISRLEDSKKSMPVLTKPSIVCRKACRDMMTNSGSFLSTNAIARFSASPRNR